MRQMMEQFINSSRETKWFILNWAIYAFLIILSTLYCYLRLDYVRSYKTQNLSQEHSNQNPS